MPYPERVGSQRVKHLKVTGCVAAMEVLKADPNDPASKHTSVKILAPRPYVFLYNV